VSSTDGHDSFDEIRANSPRHLAQSPAETTQPIAPAGGSPWRGVVVGLVGVAFLSSIIPYVDVYLQASPLASNFLPTGVFLCFLAILGVNTLLRSGRLALTRQEVLLAYITMLVPSAIPAEGLATRLIPTLVGLTYYATPANEWLMLYARHVPDWMAITHKTTVLWFFEGAPKGVSIPYELWIEPLAWWTTLVFSLYLILMSLTSVLRHQWMDAERLQFPLAQIPLTIVGDDPHPSWASEFFRNRYVWIAAAIPFALHGIAGLAQYFPAVTVPSLSGVQLGSFMSGSTFLMDPPFNVLRDIKFNLYWSVLGVSYLLRAEVSLSVWVFEWVYAVEEVLFHATGIGGGTQSWSPLHTFGYDLASRYQKVGATLLAAAFFLYLARGRIRELCRAALGRSTGIVRDEPPYEGWVIWGLLGGTAFFLGWTTSAGMDVLVSVLLLIFFLAIAIVAARIVAATGLLWVYDSFVPMHGVSKVMGTARITPQTYTMVGFIDFVALFDRSNIMPQQFDSLKIAHSNRITQKHVLVGVALGILVACVVSYVAILNLAYDHGGINLQDWPFRGGTNWLWKRIAALRRHMVFTDWTVLATMAGGALAMGGLLFVHRHFLWWPIYPLGFVIGDTVASRQIWFPVFLGWLVKTLVQKFGGQRGYTNLRPAAMGLILGEFLAVLVWLVVAAVLGRIDHKVFPVFAPS